MIRWGGRGEPSEDPDELTEALRRALESMAQYARGTSTSNPGQVWKNVDADNGFYGLHPVIQETTQGAWNKALQNGHKMKRGFQKGPQEEPEVDEYGYACGDCGAMLTVRAHYTGHARNIISTCNAYGSAVSSECTGNPLYALMQVEWGESHKPGLFKDPAEATDE